MAYELTKGKRLLKVFQEAMKINESELGVTTKIHPISDNLSKYLVTINPVDGPYVGYEGGIKFEVKIPDMYPMYGHKITGKCLSPIHHPNVYQDRSICLHTDDYGSFETGYRESLEAYIVGLNYLLIHPANHQKISDSYADTLRKNTKQREIKEKIENRNLFFHSKKDNEMYVLREYFGSELNQTLESVDIDAYFPKSCIQKVNDCRMTYMTLGGCETISIEPIEKVLSQMLRNSNYIFHQVDHPSLSDNRVKNLEPNENIITSVSSFSYPQSFVLQNIPMRSDFSENTEEKMVPLYDIGIPLRELTKTGIYNAHILMNVTIECNHELCLVRNVVSGKRNQTTKYTVKLAEGKKIIMDVLPFSIYKTYDTSDLPFFQIYLKKSYGDSPHVPPCIRLKASALILGSDCIRSFRNCYFSVKGDDDKIQYLKIMNSSRQKLRYDYRSERLHQLIPGILTESEMAAIQANAKKLRDIYEEKDDAFIRGDIELEVSQSEIDLIYQAIGSKMNSKQIMSYLASTPSEAGFD